MSNQSQEIIKICSIAKIIFATYNWQNKLRNYNPNQTIHINVSQMNAILMASVMN